MYGLDGRGEVSAAKRVRGEVSTEFLDSGLVNESSHLRPLSVHCGCTIQSLIVHVASVLDFWKRFVCVYAAAPA